MKRIAAALLALAVTGVASNASATIIAGKLTKRDDGTAVMTLLSDETSKQCDKLYPDTKFASMEIVNSRTAKPIFRFPGCYAMRENGELSISLQDTNTGKWLNYTSPASSFEKSKAFKEWPGIKRESSLEIEKSVDEMWSAMMEYEKEKAEKEAR